MGTIPESGLTFASMQKLYMNHTPLPRTAGLVNTPKTASTGLIRQATRELLKGTDRKSVMRSLATSTLRKPAAVIPAPVAPPPASSGQGGSGYSGNNAAQLGHPSNPGYATPTIPQPNP